jgi:hypothetical protein
MASVFSVAWQCLSKRTFFVTDQTPDCLTLSIDTHGDTNKVKSQETFARSDGMFIHIVHTKVAVC